MPKLGNLNSFDLILSQLTKINRRLDALETQGGKHTLASSGSIGDTHKVSGLTTGHVLQALSATTAGFADVATILTGYALLAGRSGGQTLVGGTVSGNNLVLESNSASSYAAAGHVVIQSNYTYTRAVGIGIVPDPGAGATQGLYKLWTKSNFGCLLHFATSTSGTVAMDVLAVRHMHGTSGNQTKAWRLGIYGNANTDPVTFTYGYLGVGDDTYNSNTLKWSTVGLGVKFTAAATMPTAKLHIAAGSATANTAPLKLTSGTLLTTAEPGAMEFLTDKWYGTITTGAARKEFLMGDNAITDGVNIVLGTSTGTKIGTGTSQKLGFYNATPIAQRADAAQAAAPAGGTGATEGAYDTAAHRDALINLVNEMRATLVALGLMKGSA